MSNLKEGITDCFVQRSVRDTGIHMQGAKGETLERTKAPLS